MKITVKNIKGESFTLDVHQSETIRDIKNKIKTLKNVDPETQKLILKGQIVLDEKKAEDYNIKEGDLLVLMVTKKTSNPEPKKEEKKQEPKNEPNPIIKSPTNVAGVPSNNLVLGENYNKAIDDICTMGFAREDVVKAMQAAFNNPDRAIEYLLNGIPSNVNVNVSNPENQDPIENEELPQPGVNNPIQGVNNNDPMINQLRQAIRNDPNFLQSMMSSLATTNPQLFQAISSNPEEFLRLLETNEEMVDDEEEGGMEGEVEIELTEDDKKAVDRLCALGFDKQTVLEAYLSCDKNEELTANFLFDNGHNFGDPQGN